MSSNNYWEALTPIDHIGQGRAAAFGAICEGWNSTTFEWEDHKLLFVKAPQPSFGDEEFFREVIGHRLASYFGINTSPISVVNIDDDFINDLKGTELGKHKFAAGYGIGLELVKGLITWDSSIQFREDWNDQATLIYAFDLLMGNDDRGEINPNCAVKNQRLLTYDYERIFHGGQQPVCKVSTHKFTAHHIFHRHLMGKKGQWTVFLNLLSSLNESFIREQLADVPSQWKTEARIKRLLRHISEAQSNIPTLKAELDKCLLMPLPVPGGETSS